MSIGDGFTHFDAVPSPWVSRFAALVANGGRVLDVACGAGRHSRLFAQLGHDVDAVDRDISLFVEPPARVSVMQADIEGACWPYADKKFAGVVVTNYLYRPIMATLVESVAQDGILIYETFAVGNERYGKPSRSDFLLQHGELLEAVRGRLQVVAFEDIHVDFPKPAKVQRIAAMRAAR